MCLLALWWNVTARTSVSACVVVEHVSRHERVARSRLDDDVGMHAGVRTRARGFITYCTQNPLIKVAPECGTCAETPDELRLHGGEIVKGSTTSCKQTLQGSRGWNVLCRMHVSTARKFKLGQTRQICA